MTDDDDPVPISGGDASVLVYTTDTVITVPADATLVAVAQELVGDQIGLVVLGTMAAVEGVLSERDVVRAIAEGRDPSSTRAKDVASTKIVWCDSSASVHEVAERMMEEYVRHVLLEDGGRLVGIVSARDLLGAYVMAPS
jgi:CBS domain-containing protein